jgi:urea carboxylase-associated protein 2
MTASALLWKDALRPGQAWSRRLRRNQVLRITDLEGTACVAALFYNARDFLERYNMPDTLKAQHTAFLTTGRALYSDMGRVLCSIVADSCGWHDTLCGHGITAGDAARFGVGRYQELRNDFHRNTRDNFLVELGKHGLGKRDLVANVSFFARIEVDEAGTLRWVPGASRPGGFVELRFEMDTLVVLSNTPHPLDPAERYQPGPIALSARSGPPATADDPCRLSRPENGRGFTLTTDYLTEIGELP